MTVKLPLPYRRSRSLAQGNGLLVVPGVALDVVGLDVGENLESGWRRRIAHVARAIGWPAPTFARRDDERSHTLAFAAPCDQLETARTANEWALCAALVELDPSHWGSLREVGNGSTHAGFHVQGAAPVTAAGDDAAVAWLVHLGAAEARAQTTV